MATKFIEPGGDATFNAGTTTNSGFWGSSGGTPAIATDFVNGGHIKSIKYRPANADALTTPAAVVADAGSRVSHYIYIVAYPNASKRISGFQQSGGTSVFSVILTSAGVLQIWNANTAQIGTNGATLNTGQWYRICVAYTITDTTHNRFELFVDGVSSISITNATLTRTGTDNWKIGNADNNATLDFRSSDHYIDDSSSLTDTGNVWVTAKRPNANGTTNGFTTQIGSGGSGYGTGHSPQVNERALSITNGWSVVAVGATTEEYNIESASTGDIDISAATIVDYVGWLYTKAVIAETGQIIVNNVTSNISITTGIKMFTAFAGSTTYPAGTGTDIGEITDTTATTVSLYECGIMVAYIPGAAFTWQQNVQTEQPYKDKIGIVGY